MSSEVIIMELIFSFIEMFWALLKDNFNPLLAAQVKFSLSLAQNILMSANTNSLFLLQHPRQLKKAFSKLTEFLDVIHIRKMMS